jgi:hypothetical protein
MPTNEAGLSGGRDQGDGGRSPASDMPGGERNAGVADQTGGGRAGVVPEEATRGQQSGGTSRDTDLTDVGHLGRGGDPAEGRDDPATGESWGD